MHRSGGGGGGGIRGSEPHWKITSSIGFHRNLQLDPPEKSWTPLETVGPHMEPWKIIVVLEINH